MSDERYSEKRERRYEKHYEKSYEKSCMRAEGPGDGVEALEERGDGEGLGEASCGDDRASLGRRGEDAAVRYLECEGYEILDRNWRCLYGEVDIVAYDNAEECVAFIEVKTRRNIGAGLPEEAVTAEKRGRYERIAMTYFGGPEWDESVSVRFDVIGICVTGEKRAMLRHHKGCFDGSL